MTSHEERSKLVGKKLEEKQVPQLVSPSLVGTQASLLIPLPVARRSHHGQDELQTAEEENVVTAAGASRRISAETRSVVDSPLKQRWWWGDCQPHVMLLREALLSSAPDIAVLGPLHACFSFYMTHVHKEVLSSPYGRTMTLGASVTRLESAFMWVGGWRPTSALVLVYSLMGIEIEDALEAARVGKDVVKMATTSLLSTRQLSVMHTLQKHTQQVEMKISKKLAVLQMLIGDQDMVEAVMLDAASSVPNDSSRFHRAVEKRMSRFRRLLIQAEELRLHTLKNLLSLLTPIQAARCGVAVFEVCHSLRGMGSTATLPIPAMLPGIIAVPALSGVVDASLVAGLIEPLISDASSFQNTLSSSDVLPKQSDESARLTSSCSNSAPSKLPQDSLSSQDFDSKQADIESLSTGIPTHQTKLVQTGTVGSLHEQDPNIVDNSNQLAEGIVSNRLLVLSPSTSGVTIQNCTLESATLQPFFESHGPQLPHASEYSDPGGTCREALESSVKLQPSSETHKLQLPVASDICDIGETCQNEMGFSEGYQLSGHISSKSAKQVLQYGLGEKKHNITTM